MFTTCGLQEQVLDTYEQTVEAIVIGGYTLLWRAIMIAPLTNSIIDTDAVLR